MHSVPQVMVQSLQAPPAPAERPGLHAQAPPVQYCASPHIMQFAPQCCGSEETSAQIGPHMADPCAVHVH
jgi:hypothetical protein